MTDVFAWARPVGYSWSMTPADGTGARPRIGVPVRLSDPHTADARVGEANGLFTYIIDLLREAGGEPVLLEDAADVRADLATLDGVLLPGGGDLDPRLYGQEPVEAVYDVNPDQDRLDLEAARAAIDAGLPLFGICRGHQLLNVLYGGTLVQDMDPSGVFHNGLAGQGGLAGQDAAPAGEYAGLAGQDAEGSLWAWHEVVLAAGSRAAALYGSEGETTIRIASGHHQAVATVGEGLTVTAIADDGTVEALEDPSRWVASVQWHPEASQLPEGERLAPFRAFVNVCRNPINQLPGGV